jgi:hypothetical protein
VLVLEAGARQAGAPQAGNTDREGPLLQRHRSREGHFFKGGKLFRHAIALIPSRRGAAWKNAGILYNMCSRISRNLKEFRSSAIRVGGHEP